MTSRPPRSVHIQEMITLLEYIRDVFNPSVRYDRLEFQSVDWGEKLSPMVILLITPAESKTTYKIKLYSNEHGENSLSIEPAT